MKQENTSELLLLVEDTEIGTLLFFFFLIQWFSVKQNHIETFFLQRQTHCGILTEVFLR